MSTGLLKIPSMMVQVGEIPASASSVMITQDMRAILWQANWLWKSKLVRRKRGYFRI